MRILYVVAGLAWTGGMQEYAAGLARGMVDLGHEVRILSGGRPPPDGPAPNPLAEGIETVWHPKRRILDRYVYPDGLARSIREHARWADVVHTHQPFFVGTWLAAATQAPLASSFHFHPEHLASRSGWRRRHQVSLLLRRLDLLVGSSAAELQLVSTVRTPKRSVAVWPGIDRSPPRLQLATERPLLLSVGRLNSAKGVERTLEALLAFADRCELAIVGEGVLSDRLAERCRAAGVAPGDVLRGPLPDGELEELYRRADILVSSSAQEAFGIVATKALVNGCRVVLSDIPSHREIVETLGVQDSLVPVGAPVEQLVAHIERVLAQPPPGEEVRLAIPTWVQSAGVLETAYEGLLAARRADR
jgi:glycosyltransferase involved in cell wall biosynthesis